MLGFSTEHWGESLDFSRGGRIMQILMLGKGFAHLVVFLCMISTLFVVIFVSILQWGFCV